MKRFYGLSRVRDRNGDVIKRDLKDYTNCIHTAVGGGYENMMVLVVEVWDDEDNGVRPPWERW